MGEHSCVFDIGLGNVYIRKANRLHKLRLMSEALHALGVHSIYRLKDTPEQITVFYLKQFYSFNNYGCL